MKQKKGKLIRFKCIKFMLQEMLFTKFFRLLKN